MFRSIAITLTLCLATATAQAALLGRAALTPSGTDYQAYYDDVLNITWIANANLADTNTFAVVGIDANGAMTWDMANEWIAAMNVAGHLGQSDWRMPTVGPVNGSTINYTFAYDGSTEWGFNISAPGSAYPGSTGSEMAHLYYSTLGNFGEYEVSGASTACSGASPYCRTNDGPFANIQTDHYWSGTEHAVATSEAWYFSFYDGSQSATWKSAPFRVWAVRDGDIGFVPIPPAVYLFGSALGLMGVLRRKVVA
jgi:hypothetical protein